MIRAEGIDASGRCFTCRHAYPDEVAAVLAYYKANVDVYSGFVFLHYQPPVHCNRFGRGSSPYEPVMRWYCSTRWTGNSEILNRTSEVAAVIVLHDTNEVLRDQQATPLER